jgi:hypothetical protein
VEIRAIKQIPLVPLEITARKKDPAKIYLLGTLFPAVIFR